MRPGVGVSVLLREAETFYARSSAKFVRSVVVVVDADVENPTPLAPGVVPNAGLEIFHIHGNGGVASLEPRGGRRAGRGGWTRPEVPNHAPTLEPSLVEARHDFGARTSVDPVVHAGSVAHDRAGILPLDFPDGVVFHADQGRARECRQGFADRFIPLNVGVAINITRAPAHDQSMGDENDRQQLCSTLPEPGLNQGLLRHRTRSIPQAHRRDPGARRVPPSLNGSPEVRRPAVTGLRSVQSRERIRVRVQAPLSGRLAARRTNVCPSGFEGERPFVRRRENPLRVWDSDDGRYRVRTSDLLLVRQALSQLS